MEPNPFLCLSFLQDEKFAQARRGLFPVQRARGNVQCELFPLGPILFWLDAIELKKHKTCD